MVDFAFHLPGGLRAVAGQQMRAADVHALLDMLTELARGGREGGRRGGRVLRVGFLFLSWKSIKIE